MRLEGKRKRKRDEGKRDNQGSCADFLLFPFSFFPVG